MTKKRMLLALAVVSAAAFALPSMAMAEDVPLHLAGLKTPATAKITGGKGVLSNVNGEKVECESVEGTATFESTTTGKMKLLFHKCSTVVFFFRVSCQTAGEPEGTIATTETPFHLLTIPGAKPGVLVTPNAATGVFAHFECEGVNKTVKGNGLVGEITSPKCGVKSKTSTISFAGTNGVQNIKTVEGTTTEYHLEEEGGTEAAETASGTLTLPEEATLECT